MDPIDFVTNINGQLNLVWYLNIVLFDEVWWENIWKIKRTSWERKNRKAHTWDENKIHFFKWTKEEIWCTLNGPGVGLAHLSKRDDWVIIRVDHRFGIRHCLVFPWAKNKTKENQKGRRGGGRYKRSTVNRAVEWRLMAATRKVPRPRLWHPLKQTARDRIRR